MKVLHVISGLQKASGVTTFVGAPLVVSRGMGGVKLVDDYGCGLACRANDPQDMARQLEILATDENRYAEVDQNAIRAAALIAPECQAQVILKECS